MRTRYLTGLSITLLTSGIALGALGLHPAAPGPLMMRCGVILSVASIPPWLASLTRRSARQQADQQAQHDADTYNRGYLDGLADVRRGLLDPEPPAHPGRHQAAEQHTVRHLRPLPTYRTPERKAQ